MQGSSPYPCMFVTAVFFAVWGVVVYALVKRGRRISASIERPRPPAPNHFRWVMSEDENEIIYFHASEPSEWPEKHIYALATVRTTSIASILGPQATITWRYKEDAHIARPHISLDHTPPIELYGDLPQGIKDKFDELAEVWFPAGSVDRTTGKKSPRPYSEPRDFDEAKIRWKASLLPIGILAIRYSDLRPAPAEPPAPPPAEAAITIGKTVPPPAPELDRDTTPYWEYAKREAAQPFSLPYVDRDKTLFILGQQGMGKSTLLASMIREDIQRGHGVGVIDPSPSPRSENEFSSY
jgi:hypothetical protein